MSVVSLEDFFPDRSTVLPAYSSDLCLDQDSGKTMTESIEAVLSSTDKKAITLPLLFPFLIVHSLEDTISTPKTILPGLPSKNSLHVVLAAPVSHPSIFEYVRDAPRYLCSSVAIQSGVSSNSYGGNSNSLLNTRN